MASHVIIVPCKAGSLLHYRSSTVFSRYYYAMYIRLSTSLPQQYCVSRYQCTMYSRLSTSLPQQYCVLTLLLCNVQQALYFTTVAVLCLTLSMYHVQQALYFTTVAVLCLTLLLCHVQQALYFTTVAVLCLTLSMYHVQQALYFTTVAVLCSHVINVPCIAGSLLHYRSSTVFSRYYCIMYSRLSTSLPQQYCVLTLSMYHVQQALYFTTVAVLCLMLLLCHVHQALYFTTVAVLCSHVINVPCIAGSLLHYRSSTVFSRYQCTMYSRLSTSLPQQYCVLTLLLCHVQQALYFTTVAVLCLMLLLCHVHLALYFTTVAVLCLTLLLCHVRQALYFTTVAVLCSHVIIMQCTSGSLLHYRSSTVFSRYYCAMYSRLSTSLPQQYCVSCYYCAMYIRLSTSLPQQYCVLTLSMYHVQQALYFTTVAVLCSHVIIVPYITGSLLHYRSSTVSHVIIVPCKAGSLLHYRSSTVSHVIIVPCIAGSLLHYCSCTVFSRYYCTMYNRLSTSLPQQYCVLTLLLYHVQQALYFTTVAVLCLTLLLYHVQQALYFTTVAVLCSHVIIVPCITGSLLHYRSSTVFSGYYCIMYSRLSTSLPQQYCVSRYYCTMYSSLLYMIQ